MFVDFSFLGVQGLIVGLCSCVSPCSLSMVILLNEQDAHISIHTHTHTHSHTHTYIHEYKYMYTHTYIHTYIHTCMSETSMYMCRMCFETSTYV
jgi:hypothetical protein